ncbi:MAG: hypothetical protein FWC97_01355 [Treponema sp.]|nr:hypothetical protein [Treponema sp.]
MLKNKLILPPLFGDGMIIQHGVNFPIHGTALPHSEVTVTFSGESCQTKADENGKWHITLTPVQAGGPFMMEITAEDDIIKLKDIYAGDVWLCAGQSNMEMPMQRLSDDFPEEWELPDFPVIRQFSVPQTWNFSEPQEQIHGENWVTASKETLGVFSGTAWFFAKNLNEKYNIPIGLVNTAWGGTPIESWMSKEALKDYPAKIKLGGQYADSALRKTITEKNETEIQQWETSVKNQDLGLTEEWHKPQIDISEWNDIDLPGDFAQGDQHEELTDFCGVIWLAREFDINNLALKGRGMLFSKGIGLGFNTFRKRPEGRGIKPSPRIKDDFIPTDVWMGTIADSDYTYLNGLEIGNITYRYPPRKYKIPPNLIHEGKNRIVIRVTCNRGDGGITKEKPFRLFSENNILSLAGKWKYRIGAKESRRRPDEFFFQWQPMGTFNAMIAPILKYPFKGVIWYQGESNEKNSDEYANLFRSMIQDWREKAGTKDLPFLFVQLPIFGNPSENNEANSWAFVREAQYSALSLPFTGMAAALDTGEWNELHPFNKKEIARRLFLAFERLVNKQDNTSPGPVFRNIERNENQLLLTFDNCGKGLAADSTPYLTIITDGDVFRLPAEIVPPNKLSIDISTVKNPQKVLYAWASNPKDRQLFNQDGLPMIPFRVVLM